MPQSPLCLTSSQPTHPSHQNLAEQLQQGEISTPRVGFGRRGLPTCGVQGGRKHRSQQNGGPYSSIPLPSLLSQALASAPPKRVLGFCSPPDVHSFSHAGWSVWQVPTQASDPSSLSQGNREGPASSGSDTS